MDEPVASIAAGSTSVVSSAGIACVATTSSDDAESIAGCACGDSGRVCASVSPLAKRLWTDWTAHCLLGSGDGTL